MGPTTFDAIENFLNLTLEKIGGLEILFLKTFSKFDNVTGHSALKKFIKKISKQSLFFYRNKVIFWSCFCLFFWYLVKIAITIIRSLIDVARLFFFTFVFEKEVLKMLKEKSVVFFSGSIGSGKELLLYYLYKKFNSHLYNPYQQESSRFFISSLKKNKVIDISKKEEISYFNLMDQYKNGCYKDLIYEVGDGNINSKIEEEEAIANEIAKKIYLNGSSTIFFSCFAKGFFSKKIESFADCEIIFKGYRKAIFGKYIILNTKMPRNHWLSKRHFHYYRDNMKYFAFWLFAGNSIFLKRSVYEEFISKVYKNESFENYF